MNILNPELSETTKAFLEQSQRPAWVTTTTPEAPVRTLRDEFAMAALTGMLATSPTASNQDLAFVAYTMADAMLKAREAHE